MINRTADDALERHFRNLVALLAEGRVVPFLGAGANMCSRPDAADWQWLRNREAYLPSGRELSQYLADLFHCEEEVDRGDLARVSQSVYVTNGSADLYDKLHALFDRDYPPTALHRFLAEIPSLLRAKGYTPRYSLIVTTNYDDVLERAFREAGEPFDLVTYIAEGADRGKFVHTRPDGVSAAIILPNEYREFALDRRSVILKIHGAVVRNAPDGENDSYVITEDHYIDYLTRTELNVIPATLAAALKRSHFLFLGYGLRDWNLRVLLHRIVIEQKLTRKSWAIQRVSSELDQKFWSSRDVNLLDFDLEEYIEAARHYMLLLPPASVTNA